MKTLKITYFLFFITLSSQLLFSQVVDHNTNLEKRVNDLLTQLTIEEKISLIGGTGFATTPIERLGIPPLNMADGPLGVRWDKGTAFPSGISMASTWEPSLIYKIGKAIAEETKAHERHVILGPCVNIARIPQGGRNFESFGEDPFLTTRIGVDYIKGVQSENVVATVKHFAVNNQEHERMFVNTIVDKRALNEIYFPAFKAAVEEANVLAFMSAYNKLNGHYASENDFLLIETLKKKWNFQGLVMSDWGAVHSSIPTFNGGLDLEMPTGKYLNKETLLDELVDGELDINKLDDKVRRILRVMLKIGLFDNYQYDITKLNNEEHKQLAYESAVKGIILLKNNYKILPINTDMVKSIAVIGPNAAFARIGGGGSSQVLPFYSVSPLEAFRNKLGDNTTINYAQGVVIDGEVKAIEENYFFTDEKGTLPGVITKYYTNKSLDGEPKITVTEKAINNKWTNKSPIDGIGEDVFSVSYEGFLKFPQDGSFALKLLADDGVRLYLNDKLVIDDWNEHSEKTSSFQSDFKKGILYKFKVEYFESMGDATVILGWQTPNDNILKEAVETAKSSDLAIVFVGTSNYYESEGYDRENLSLPTGQDELIEEVYKANRNTIVVITSGSPVLTDKWINKIPAVIQAWFGGQEIGNAIADVIIGKFNPSAKLPVTYPQKWEDCSAFTSYKKEDGITKYTDGIYVGYRHFEKNKITPLFPFGYGLSYTTFAYSELKTKKIGDSITVSYKIKNTGGYDGAEISQLYIMPINPIKDRPIKELKGFNKVYLKSNEESFVNITFSRDSFKYFEESIDNWKLDSGKYKLLIGASSVDIKLETEIEIN